MSDQPGHESPHGNPQDPFAKPSGEAHPPPPGPPGPPFGTPHQQGYPQAPYGASPYGASPYGGMPYVAAPPATNGKAVAALVLGIVSIVGTCGFFTGIPAIILARQSMAEIDASQGAQTGRGMAQAGFWTGIVGSVLMVLLIIFYIGVLVFLFAVESSTSTTVGV